MRLLSATDLAIALAAKRGTLRLIERPSRLGGMFVSIEDERGIIEAAADQAAADARVSAITARAGVAR